MTSCADVRENISAYADNELSASERESFEEHISRCPSCRDELEDMLRIIAICRSMPQQELPEGFKAELHEKLTAVSARQTNIHVIREKPKKIVFARTIASIAAGILLIFLGGGIIRFGLFSGGFMSKSSDNADMTASTPAPSAKPAENSLAYSINEAQDMDIDGFQSSEPMADAPMDALSMDYGIMDSGNGAEITAKSFTANRSVEKDERDNGHNQGMNAEAATSKTATITVTTRDIAAASGKVTILAAVNNGMAPAENIAFDGQDIPETSALSIHMEEENTQKQLQYVFAEADYSAFAAALNDTFGAADVQTGAFVSEDMTDTINVLIDQSVMYDAEIQKLQNDNNAKAPEEINKLKKEKESIDEQIEWIRLNSDFVTVTIYVNMK